MGSSGPAACWRALKTLVKFGGSTAFPLTSSPRRPAKQTATGYLYASFPNVPRRDAATACAAATAGDLKYEI